MKWVLIFCMLCSQAIGTAEFDSKRACQSAGISITQLDKEFRFICVPK